MLPRAGGFLLAPLLLFLIACIGASSAQKLNTECQTPDGKRGTCVMLRSCQSIRQLVLKKDRTPAERDFLMKSQCGIENRSVLACCPLPSRISGRFGERVDLPSTADCGRRLDDRIFGGEEARLGDYPWLARIQYYKGNDRYGFHCGGVLIHKQFVLTAAHCIEGVPSSWIVYQVRLGEHDTTKDKDCELLEDGEQVCADPVRDVLVLEYLVHPDYYKENGADYNDIAVLKLSESVESTEFISPICVPTSPNTLPRNLTDISMVVAGWGQTQTRSSSTKLMHLNVPVWDNSRCSEVFQPVSLDIVPTQVCAGGEKGKDSCRGDSGGPLMYRRNIGTSNWYLVGLVSFGLERCGSDNVPGVYTRISEYMNWVQDTLEGELGY